MVDQRLCPACLSDQVDNYECISAQDIMLSWCKFRSDISQAVVHYLETGNMPETVCICKCRACKLEFSSPPLAGNSQWYKLVENYPVRWEYDQCINDLRCGQADILEIGCGEGHFLELAVRHGHRIMGLDINEEAIAKARTKGLEAYAWDLKELKLRIQRRFSAVAFFHVIEHLEDPGLLLAELANAVPIGSSMHFSCPSPQRYTTYLEPEYRLGLREVWDYPPHHQTRWNPLAVEKLVARFGWRLQKHIEEPFNWRGVATYLAGKQVKLSELSPIQRKLRILGKLIQTAIPALKYTGISTYYMALRI